MLINALSATAVATNEPLVVVITGPHVIGLMTTYRVPHMQQALCGRPLIQIDWQ